ncbi:M15 family metallopeptidase [Streptomyces vinaceus]|uniref:M15 family metallopeptidase n=1 Tax=Streptomyces vinaceus TaxID=1960 RepID=UPI0035D8FA20
MAPDEFVDLADVDSTIWTDMRYAKERNVVGVPLDGYVDPICVVTCAAAKALSKAQTALSGSGYSLQVLDGYRPVRAVRHIIRWAHDLDDQRTKPVFYPQVEKERLFTDGYLHQWSSHSRGSTVDVTLVTSEGLPVDMGSTFGGFGARSRTLHAGIRADQRARRLYLKRTMERAGFVNLPEEWWHYTYRTESFPDVYFDFPVSRLSLRRVVTDVPPIPSGAIPQQRSGE